MKLLHSTLIPIALSLGTLVANGEKATQVGSMSAGRSWLDGAYFSDGLPAHSGADYVLDTAANLSRRA